METQRTIALEIIKRQLKYLESLMRKQCLENLTLQGHIANKMGEGNSESLLNKQCKWIVEQELVVIVRKQILQKL